MGAGYFIIAILGCADGSSACTPIATMPTRYESEAACAAATSDALLASTEFDFPSMIAECKSMRRPATAEQDEQPKPVPAGARHS